MLEPDDCVLVRIFAFEGKNKLSNKWNYVESQPNPVPVYILYKEADRSSKRTLHQNHLLPIGHASDARTDSQGTSSNQEVTNKHRPKKRTPDATDKGGTITQFLEKSKSAHKLLRMRMKMSLHCSVQITVLVHMLVLRTPAGVVTTIILLMLEVEGSVDLLFTVIKNQHVVESRR